MQVDGYRNSFYSWFFFQEFNGMHAFSLANTKFDLDHDIFNEGQLVIQTVDYLLIAAVKNVFANGFTLNDFATLDVITRNDFIWMWFCFYWNKMPVGLCYIFESIVDIWLKDLAKMCPLCVIFVLAMDPSLLWFSML